MCVSFALSNNRYLFVNKNMLNFVLNAISFPFFVPNHSSVCINFIDYNDWAHLHVKVFKFIFILHIKERMTFGKTLDAVFII